MNVTEILEPIADIFRNLGIPEPITHWGHPVMMGTVIFTMGIFAGISGWRGRVTADETVAMENLSNHRKIVPFMFLFLALGYFGGVLSLVMQRHSIFESPHFGTGSLFLALGFGNHLLRSSCRAERVPYFWRSASATTCSARLAGPSDGTGIASP